MKKCTIESRDQIHNFEFQEEKFWDRVVILGDDKCWKWSSYTDGRGRGRINIPKKPDNLIVATPAPRLSYIINIGDIPPGLFVLHTCDNPECCNPKHLWIGTNQDNIQDASKKGRMKHSEETNRKIAEARTGTKHSDETRKKISESNKLSSSRKTP